MNSIIARVSVCCLLMGSGCASSKGSHRYGVWWEGESPSLVQLPNTNRFEDVVQGEIELNVPHEWFGSIHALDGFEDATDGVTNADRQCLLVGPGRIPLRVWYGESNRLSTKRVPRPGHLFLGAEGSERAYIWCTTRAFAKQVTTSEPFLLPQGGVGWTVSLDCSADDIDTQVPCFLVVCWPRPDLPREGKQGWVFKGRQMPE